MAKSNVDSQPSSDLAEQLPVTQLNTFAFLKHFHLALGTMQSPGFPPTSLPTLSQLLLLVGSPPLPGPQIPECHGFCSYFFFLSICPPL